ncbi:hypothetical protein ACUUL3_02560 [Thiovibrio sp. JS02]
MPQTYTYNAAENVLTSISSGRITLSDIMNHFSMVERDPLVQADYIELVTFSEDVEILFNSTEAKNIPAAYKKLKANKGIRATVFLGATPLTFGIGRMMESMHEVFNPEDDVRVVHTMAEARREIEAIRAEKG